MEKVFVNVNKEHYLQLTKQKSEAYGLRFFYSYRCNFIEQSK
jgi:hypothetical protein